MSAETALREALVATLRDLRESGERSALSGHVHMTDEDLADLILSDPRMGALASPESRSLDVVWRANHDAVCSCSGDGRDDTCVWEPSAGAIAGMLRAALAPADAADRDVYSDPSRWGERFDADGRGDERG